MFSIRTAMEYCKDDVSMIPGYAEASKSNDIWELHHVMELTINGEYAHSMKELIRLGMYYKRPYFELVFLPKVLHQSMHLKVNNPSTVSEIETKKNISRALKGHYGWNRGKKWTDSTKDKMRQAHVGKRPSLETLSRLKQIAEARKNAYREYKNAGGILMYNSWSRDIWNKELL